MRKVAVAAVKTSKRRQSSTMAAAAKIAHPANPYPCNGVTMTKYHIGISSDPKRDACAVIERAKPAMASGNNREVRPSAATKVARATRNLRRFEAQQADRPAVSLECQKPQGSKKEPGLAEHEAEAAGRGDDGEDRRQLPHIRPRRPREGDGAERVPEQIGRQ